MTQAIFTFNSAGRSDPGLVRDHNEDSMLERPDLCLWAVADGMGGHEQGEVASGLIVEALGRIEPQPDPRRFLSAVKTRIQEANTALVERAAGLKRGGLIASTVVCLMVSGGYYACVWAGDSRLYLKRGGRLKQVSRDHSVVQNLLDAGEITEAAARVHPLGNQITRAVGADPELSIDVVQGRVEHGDLFLLCSDGLSRMLDDAEIEILLDEADLPAMIERLIKATYAAGASDNVTVIAVRCEGRVGRGQMVDEAETTLVRPRAATVGQAMDGS
jgi:serine/threonine protein phosphatase PrpC